MLGDWLGTQLTALDGRVMGSLHLVNEREGEFTGLHEAVVVHVAQMSAAAMERALLYSGGRGSRTSAAWRETTSTNFFGTETAAGLEVVTATPSR